MGAVLQMELSLIWLDISKAWTSNCEVWDPCWVKGYFRHSQPASPSCRTVNYCCIMLNEKQLTEHPASLHFK